MYIIFSHNFDANVVFLCLLVKDGDSSKLACRGISLFDEFNYGFLVISVIEEAINSSKLNQFNDGSQSRENQTSQS